MILEPLDPDPQSIEIAGSGSAKKRSGSATMEK